MVLRISGGSLKRWQGSAAGSDAGFDAWDGAKCDVGSDIFSDVSLALVWAPALALDGFGERARVKGAGDEAVVRLAWLFSEEWFVCCACSLQCVASAPACEADRARQVRQVHVSQGGRAFLRYLSRHFVVLLLSSDAVLLHDETCHSRKLNCGWRKSRAKSSEVSIPGC